MTLTRKRRKELNRLKNQAEDLWQDQRELLDHASKVVREAKRQASNYAREEVGPRVRDTYEDRIVPAVGAGIAGAKSAAGTARDKVVHDVIPGVAGALGTAIAAIEVAKDKQVRAAIASASRFGHDVGVKTGIVKPAPAPGPGRYILIGLGVVAVAAVAYAAWQTLRADDDLWIDDDVEPLEAAEGAPESTTES